VFEIFEFSLIAGADVAAFIAADQRVQMEFFYQQPGLVRRTTSRGRDGRWAVITLWGSEEEAEACAKVSLSDDAYVHFMSFIDSSSIEVKRYFGLEG
jgi:hypothetical protein